ncbi:MAG TPA: choice-of-anchor tandem repeat GloVer-containing protein [Candidatus Cybelea sp.]|jgi:uncharacterized repeat protein (TIGR03803 family)|nr:choice-of-anchor tandem repeat GloVer-containing protein [Candidatus Cybelea sp.]
MKSLRFRPYGLSVCVAVVMAAGCGGGSGTPPTPAVAGKTAERAHPDATYGVLYSFAGSSKGDGETPEATLLEVEGKLYGTTILGGTNGDGTVFSVTPSGTETVLHSFGGSGDGAYPESGFLRVNGTLYGTTMEGGTSGYGTVFSITPSGKERVLHSFGRSKDGSYPVAGLINVNGTLYGTTANGGANDDGIVFSITPSGTENVLYSFKGGSADGEDPHAGLVNVSGTLYGTTYEGGARNEGTVFAITPSGKEKKLHSFLGNSDGAFPVTGLVYVKGMLYGTTTVGGVYCSPSRYCGTVFAISPAGKEAVLHSFGHSGDGEVPFAGLINVSGTLYGTTEFGGVNCTQFGCGTVFSITPSGKENVLLSFGGTDEGGYPEAGLLNANDTYYGTTSGGGANNFGTVFSLKL